MSELFHNLIGNSSTSKAQDTAFSSSGRGPKASRPRGSDIGKGIRVFLSHGQEVDPEIFGERPLRMPGISPRRSIGSRNPTSSGCSITSRSSTGSGSSTRSKNSTTSSNSTSSRNSITSKNSSDSRSSTGSGSSIRLRNSIVSGSSSISRNSISFGSSIRSGNSTRSGCSTRVGNSSSSRNSLSSGCSTNSRSSIASRASTGHRKSTNRGFTLIEVIIATTILASMGAMTYGSVRQAYMQKQEIEAAQERDSQVRAAMDLLVYEISHAFLSDHYDRNRYRERPTFFKGQDRGRRDELNFTTLAHERLEIDSKVSDQAAIRYWVDRDPESRSEEALFRRVNPIIDEEAERRGASAVLCEGVRGFELEYWDGRKQEWVDEWDSSRPERLGVLPSRVRITLTVADENGQDRVFSTQTRIAIRRALRF